MRPSFVLWHAAFELIFERFEMSDVSPETDAVRDSRRRRDKWFARLAGFELGPMFWSDLVAMAKRRELCPSDEIRLADCETWTAASENELLFPDNSKRASHIEHGRPDADPTDSPGPPPVRKTDLPAGRRPRQDTSPSADSRQRMAQPVEPDVTEDDVLQILTEPGHDRVAEPPKAVTQLSIAQPAAQAPAPSGTFPGSRVPHIPKHRTSTLRRLAGLPLEWPKTSGALLASPVLLALLIIAMTPSYDGLKVTGNVTLDGAPVVDATVTFYSANSGVGASSILDESGQFEMKTHKGGLPPDNYAVYVYSPRHGAIPEHYSSLKTSGLSFDVSEQGSVIEIELESD